MRLKYRGNYRSNDVNWFWFNFVFISYRIDSNSAVAVYFTSTVSTVKIHRRFDLSVAREKMTRLYTFAFIKLMCCNFINTLTLNRLSISPACCVYYHSRPGPSNLWIILIPRIRAWLCRYPIAECIFVHTTHIFSLYASAKL